MSGERPAPLSEGPSSPPGDDELRAMLEGRASRVGATDTREVLAAARARITGHGAAPGSEIGERDGRTFGVRPVRAVRLEPRVPGRGPRMPWRLAVLGVAAVVAVAVLGSRLALRPADVDTGGSPTAGAASPRTETPRSEVPSLAPIAVLTAAQLTAGIADGSLDGRTVLVRARLVTDPVPCPTATEDCFELHIDGPLSIPVTRTVTLEAFTRNAGTGVPFAVSIAAGRVVLLGWVVDGVDVLRRASELGIQDIQPASGDLMLVQGWLAPAHGDANCLMPVSGGCDGSHPRLTDSAPFIDGTWTDGVPGIDVAIPESFGLDEDKEVMVGRFLVAAGPLRFGGNPPHFSVVAALDGGIQRVDQQVAPASPAPVPSATPVPSSSPLPATTTRTLTNAQVMAALESGSRDGRLLVIDAELRTVAAACPAGVPDPCTRFSADGLPGIALTWDGALGGSDGSDGGAGVSALAWRMVVVPRGGHLELLGRLDTALDAPERIGTSPALAGSDPLGLRSVAGWLVHTPAPPGCPPAIPNADVSCVGAGDVISDQPPEGESLPWSVTQMPVVVRDGRPGLGSHGTLAGGPFLLRPRVGIIACPFGASCETVEVEGWEVVARYDPADIERVLLP